MGEPFVQAADQAWAAKVSKLSKSIDGPTVTFTGLCPRCDDRMSCTLEVGPVPRADGSKAFRAEAFRPKSYVVSCNCTGAHEGRPAGESGCGAFGALEVVSGG